MKILTWQERCSNAFASHPDNFLCSQMQAEIDALRAAITQLKPEPVAWLHTLKTNGYQEADMCRAKNTEMWTNEPLYTTPVQPVYVPLSDSDIETLSRKFVSVRGSEDNYEFAWRDFARAIEKAVRGVQ